MLEALVWEAGGENSGEMVSAALIWEAGSGASRASGSIEDDNEAWEEGGEDDCESIRGFFGLPLRLPFGVEGAGLLPLLPPVRVSPKGVLEPLAGLRKGAGR